jgi:nucleotide-binding universal stress UspA family protein
MSWLKKECVVVPTDFSDVSIKALNVADEFVDDKKKIHFVHVAWNLDEYTIGGPLSVASDEQLEKHINFLKTRLKEELENADYKGAQFALLHGNPPVEIVRYAQEMNADLIVMPSHGRTGLKEWALGSVSERVLRRASCPVMIIK